MHGHGFDLLPGPITDIKSGGDFAFFARIDHFLLGLGRSAPARCPDRFKTHGGLADIFIFEMGDRLLVVQTGVQLDCILFPFQFRARAKAEEDGQGEGQDAGFHFCE